MSRKIFVGGLPWATDDARLREFFADCGEVVDAKVILDRETNRSRGFGFVTFDSPESAQKALALDGRALDGRNIKLDLAEERPRDSRPGGDRPSESWSLNFTKIEYTPYETDEKGAQGKSPSRVTFDVSSNEKG